VITRHLLGTAALKPDQADNGAVTPIQRFGSAANLNIRLHCFVLAGVDGRGVDGTPEFVEAARANGRSAAEGVAQHDHPHDEAAQPLRQLDCLRRGCGPSPRSGPDRLSDRANP
jgi:hypothetical protein